MNLELRAAKYFGVQDEPRRSIKTKSPVLSDRAAPVEIRSRDVPRSCSTCLRGRPIPTFFAGARSQNESWMPPMREALSSRNTFQNGDTMAAPTKFDRPMQIIETDRGAWEISVARHSEAPTFTFDIVAPTAHVTEMNGTHRVLSCHNMTRADLVEHVQRCEAALKAVPNG